MDLPVTDSIVNEEVETNLIILKKNISLFRGFKVHSLLKKKQIPQLFVTGKYIPVTNRLT